MKELRWLSWNCTMGQLWRLAVLFLVAATLPWATLPVCAASSTPAEVVCNVSADYALGMEDYPRAIRLHESILRHDPKDALAHYHLGKLCTGRESTTSE